MLATVETALNDHFGQPPARASVSFLGVERMEVLRYVPAPGEVAYASLGMGRRPMTSLAASAADRHGPRAELLLQLRATGKGTDEVWRALGVLAAAPAVEGVVYTPGMTVDLGQPLAPGSACTGAVVVPGPVAPVPLATEPGQDSDVVVLQLLPATATELAWARVHGAQALQTRWAERQCDLLDLGRRGVELPATPA